MELSPYVHIFKDDDGTNILYHRFNLSAFDCDDAFLERLQAYLAGGGADPELQQGIEQLAAAGFFSTLDHEKISASIHHTPVRINRYRIVLTTRCNFNCKYCFVILDKKDLLWENLQVALDAIIKRNLGEVVTLQFFGGEPLVRFEFIKQAVAYMEEHGKVLKGVQYYITTNGALISDEIAQYFKEHNFHIGVSLDGPRQLNDTNRVLLNGMGTYDLAVRGFKKLKEHDVKNFILVTPSPGNLGVLFSICEHVVNELQPDSLTINMPQYNYGWGIDGKKFAEQLQRIMLMCAERNMGLTSPGSQILGALQTKTPVLRTCSSTFETAQASITVDGRITYCPINFDTDLFPEHVSPASLEKKELQQWMSHAGIDDATCRNCIALGVCGGVCPMQSKKKHPAAQGLVHDKSKCDFFQTFTPWAVKNF